MSTVGKLLHCRRLVSLGIGAVAAAVVLAILLFEGGNHRLAAFHRIKAGMTEAEVAAVLGRPAGDLSTCDLVMTGEEDATPDFRYSTKPSPWSKAWRDNRAHILVEFEDGRVTQALFQGMRPKSETTFQRLMHTFGLEHIFGP